MITTAINSTFWNTLFLCYLPYMAIAVMVVGAIARYRYLGKTIQATSTQFIDNGPMIKVGSYLWHYGIILVLLGHIFGLLTPMKLYELVMTPETKRILAISMGLLFGTMAFVGGVILAVRRFCNPAVSVNSTFQDKWILVWLLGQIGLGLACTMQVIDEPLSSYISFDNWAQGLVTFHPDAWKYIADADLLHKLHIVDGFLIFLVFPFSKLMHFIVFPVNYLWRRGRQIVWRRKNFTE